MSFRTSASFGKRQEYVAIAELLRRGFDVYMTLVDDQQIDCIIRQERAGELIVNEAARAALAQNQPITNGHILNAAGNNPPRPHAGDDRGNARRLSRSPCRKERKHP